MDKNTLTGILLMLLMLLAYNYFVAPPIELQNPKTQISKRDSLPHLIQKDTSKIAKLTEDFPKGEEKEFVVDTKNSRIIFSSKGGAIKSVWLKKYQTYDHKPLLAFDQKFSSLKINVPTSTGELLVNNFYFTTDAPSTISLEEKDSRTIVFVGEINKQKIKQTYTISGNSYAIQYNLSLENGTTIKNDTIGIHWEENLVQTEKDITENKKGCTLNYYSQEGEFDYLNEDPNNLVKGEFNDKLKWITFKKKYFLSGIIALQTSFLNSKFQSDPSGNSKKLSLKTSLSAQDLTQNKGNFTFYFGPNDYQKINPITDGFYKNIDLGYKIFHPINRYVFIPLFNFLEGIFSNYGILIIVLVLIIKIVLTPLTYKSYVGMAKMRVLQPELTELKEKIGEKDAAKLQQEQMKLYQEVGVSPLSGCIPVLATMPILMSVFFLFPNLIELRQKSFLWSDDLSTYDSILKLPFSIPFYGNHVSLFTLMMTVSSVIYAWFNNQTTPSTPGPVDMKMMGYVTPVIFMFVMNSFPAGLSFYYFVSNVITVLQQLLIRRWVDENKIKELLDKNRKKFLETGGKKSKFQDYLQQSLQKAQEAQKDKKKK